MVQIALQPEQLAAAEDLVDRHLLGHVAEPRPHPPRIGQGIEARQADTALVGSQQGGQDAQGGRFAGAVGTEQAVETALGDGEGDPLQSHDAAVTLGQALKLNHRRSPPRGHESAAI